MGDGGVERCGERAETVFDVELQGFRGPVLEEAAFAEGLLGGFAGGPEVATEGRGEGDAGAGGVLDCHDGLDED